MWLLGVQLLLRTYRQQLGELWELLGEITISVPNVDFSYLGNIMISKEFSFLKFETKN